MNDKNLIQNQNRTPSERRENARKAGKASGVSRGFRAAFKKRIMENPSLIDDVLDALHDEATSGNVKAIQLEIELRGEGNDEQDKKLKKAQLEKLKADTDRIKADTERINAETELLRLKAQHDPDGDSGEAAAALAQALDASASAVWKENDNADKTGAV